MTVVIIFNHYWIIHHSVVVTVDKASKKSRVQFMHRKGTHETNKDQDQHIINALKTVKLINFFNDQNLPDHIQILIYDITVTCMKTI